MIIRQKQKVKHEKQASDNHIRFSLHILRKRRLAKRKKIRNCNLQRFTNFVVLIKLNELNTHIQPPNLHDSNMMILHGAKMRKKHNLNADIQAIARNKAEMIENFFTV